MAKWLVWLSVLLMLAGCSAVQILNATAPRANIVTRTAIYAHAPDRALDVYAPAPGCGNAPVVVFLFGGSWQEGDRATYHFLGDALAKRGIVTIIPQYRLYPAVRFPAFMDDAAYAVAWAHAHAAQYGGDPNHLFIMGHSAGAQMAVLLALDTRYLRAARVDPRIIAGVIGLSGPYDFLPLTDPVLQQVFGPENTWSQSQPINFVTSAAPPMFLATGTADTTVYPRNTDHLAARLRAANVPVREQKYPGIGHELMIGAFATPLSLIVSSRRDTLNFIATYHAIPDPGKCKKNPSQS